MVSAAGFVLRLMHLLVIFFLTDGRFSSVKR
nr:MAG TPA: hypothetical protein [Caudoviricetes sp.]